MIFFNSKQKVNFTLVGGVRVYDLGRFHMSKKPTTFQWNNGTSGSKAEKTRREQSARVWNALNGSYITNDSTHSRKSIADANKELLSNIRETRSHITTDNKETFVEEDNSLLNSLDENEKQLLEDNNHKQNVRLQELQGKTAGIEKAKTTARKAGLDIDYNIIFERLYSNDINSNEGNARIALEEQVNKHAKKLGIKGETSVRFKIITQNNELKNRLRGVSRIKNDKEVQKATEGKNVNLAEFGSYSSADKAYRELIKKKTGRKPTNTNKKKTAKYSKNLELENAER
jgi:nucleoid DNA-binding protein